MVSEVGVSLRREARRNFWGLVVVELVTGGQHRPPPPPSKTALPLGGVDPPPRKTALPLGGVDPPPRKTALPLGGVDPPPRKTHVLIWGPPPRGDVHPPKPPFPDNENIGRGLPFNGIESQAVRPQPNEHMQMKALRLPFICLRAGSI